jgi:glycosyltransferase involved in cell wall biosynthesis
MELGLERQKRRVAVVHDGYIPRYRVRLYELLAEISDIEYVVFHGPPPKRNPALRPSGPLRFPNVEVPNYELRLGPKAVVWQGLVRQIARGGFDALVMGAWLRFVSGLVLFPAFKAMGRPVILWGQGRDKQEDSATLLRPLMPLAETAKARIANLADGYLVYTDAGARDLAARGVRRDRIFVVHNTIDMEEQVALHAELAGADLAALRADLGLREESSVLLYVGRLYSEKRVEELVASARALNAGGSLGSPVEVVVIGDGPDRSSVAMEADGDPYIHLRGEVSDQREIARHMKVASAVVLPGKAGLAVNHAFGHGVPVITSAGDFHAPEFAYISQGRNGLIAESSAELPDVLSNFLSSAELQRRLAAGALEARDGLGADAMAAAFDRGVRTVLAGRGKERTDPDR